MANTGDIPNNITLGASQTVRRNAADNGFEAFTPSGGPHAILSTTHTDTLVDSVVRGDLIVGNLTPKWARLALGGSDKSFVTRDANDVVWSTGMLDVATGKTLTVSNSLTLSGTDGKTLDLLTNLKNDGGNGSLVWPVAGATLTIPVTGTAAIGAGTLSSTSTNDVTGSAHTHAITSSPALLGNGTAQYQTIITGATPFAPVYSGFLLDGTTGGKTVFAVTNTKTLTLTATDSYNLTIPATGTAALGAGTLTVSTTNDVTGSAHTHAITSSSNPGIAASLLATDASGELTLSAAPNLAGGSDVVLNYSNGGLYSYSILKWSATGTARIITLPDLSGTVALGAGTATVSSTNSVTVASHTHAITSSSAPGAAASILATDASGNLTIGGAFGVSAGTARIREYNVTSLANNGTAALLGFTGSGNAAYGLIFVYSSEGYIAIYQLNGGFKTTNEITDTGGLYSPTAGTASSTNIYFSVGNDRYEIENKRGITVSYRILQFMYI